MGLIARVRRARVTRERARADRERHRTDLEYLLRWGGAHAGVEVFVEPQTMINELSVVLVDGAGSWTRRAPGGPKAVRRLGRELGVPVHDVLETGYPQRMRDNIERARIRRRKAERAALTRQLAELAARDRGETAAD